MQPNTWMQSILKIIFIGDGVALGVEVSSCATKAGSPGRKVLFNTSGLGIGWVYGENRPEYRLQSLDRIKNN